MNLLIRTQSSLLVYLYCLLLSVSSLISVNSIAVGLDPIAKIKTQIPSAEVIPGELLVKFKQSLARKKVSVKAGRYKARSKRYFKTLGVEYWKLNASQNLQQVITELQNDPDVELVEPNYRRYPRSIQANIIDDYPQNYARLNDLNLPKLWEKNKIHSTVKVAVIDDAFDINHPDLKANIVLPYDAMQRVVDSTTMNPSNIKVDDDPSPEVCTDLFTNEPTYPVNDPSYLESHGTMVAGVLGAVSNNGIGIDGAADNAQIIPIRISCNYSVAAEYEAFRYAIEQRVDIINISWGGPQFSEFERLATAELLKEGILVVVAAGNNDSDNDRVLDYPSGLDLPNILSVAAISDNQTLTSWSQYGQTTVDIAAPGNLITTLARGNNYVKNVRGTSFSAPLVAGVAASLLARSPEQTTALELKAAIMASAKPFSDNLRARLATDGYVDALAAFEALNNPKPLPVISSIKIDDSGPTGNGNGEVDPGESVNLKVTISNIGAAANSINAVLRSSTLGSSVFKFADASNVPGFDLVEFQYGRVTLEFTGVEFFNYYQAQNVAFELYLTSYWGANNSKTEAVRFFNLDAGSLAVGTPINNTLRSNDDNQDEFHYYHVNLDTSQQKLVIELTMADSSSDIDLLVKYNSPPQFSYDDYENVQVLDRFEAGTEWGVEDGNRETVTVKNAAAGTYHIVVIADSDIKLSNMAYTLSASTDRQKFSAGAQGCSLGKSDKIDPIFYLLCLLSLWRIGRSSKSKLYWHQHR